MCLYEKNVLCIIAYELLDFFRAIARELWNLRVLITAMNMRDVMSLSDSAMDSLATILGRHVSAVEIHVQKIGFVGIRTFD